MFRTHITTPVAVYISTTTDINPLAGYAKLHPDHHILMRNGLCETVFSAGPKGIIPAIWTPQPVPVGLDIEALKAQFELRASVMLADYDRPVDFTPSTDIGDARYNDINVRCAWIMYVDLAIQNFSLHPGQAGNSSGARVEGISKGVNQ